MTLAQRAALPLIRDGSAVADGASGACQERGSGVARNGASERYASMDSATERRINGAREPVPNAAWAVIEQGEITLEEWVARARDEVRP